MGNESVFGKTHRLLVKSLEWTLIAMMGALVLDVLWGVFSRYVLNAQSSWTEELAIYLLIWVSLLGGSLVFGEKGHLGVDYFVKKLDISAQRIAAFCVELVALAFSAYALIYGGWMLVSSSLEKGQLSSAMQLPVGYVYLAVPISGCFFCLFAIEHLLEIIAGEADLESDESIKEV